MPCANSVDCDQKHCTVCLCPNYGMLDFELFEKNYLFGKIRNFCRKKFIL